MPLYKPQAMNIKILTISPKALALAITNITKGRNGKNASSIGSKIPGNWPNADIPELSS